MRDKISKIKNVIKKYGIMDAAKKILKYIRNKLRPNFNIKVILKTKREKKIYISELKNSIKKAERIVIWRSSFGWNVPLYQRPQHIANCLSKNNTVVLYEVTEETDNVLNIKKQQENLFLVNFNNLLLKKWITEILKETQKPKYIQIYSTNWSMSVSELEEYIDQGHKVIYEYIDDLSPVLAGTDELPINIKEKYEYVMSHVDNVYVVVTAEEIKKDVIKKRGNKNLVFACNGVDYNFFKKIDPDFCHDEQFKKILESKKPIIGYYGALAGWFDYDMVKFLAEKRKKYEIVLFGIKYDDTFDKAKLNSYENIHFLGARDYAVLKNYAKDFSVCTIPFLINSITEATSPVKLFEYMALEKPIVTTAMNECKKYKSVMIANDKEQFVKLIDKSVEMSLKPNEHKEYYEVLEKEALENDWTNKTKAIIELIKKDE